MSWKEFSYFRLTASLLIPLAGIALRIWMLRDNLEVSTLILVNLFTAVIIIIPLIYLIIIVSNRKS